MSISGDFPPTGEGGDTAGWSGSPEDDASLDNFLNSFPSEDAERKVYVLEGLVQQLKEAKRFIESQGWRPGEDSVITYHGSAADTSLSMVFGNKVVHIDPDSASMEALKKEGLIAETKTFEEYLEQLPPDTQIDLLFLYNSTSVDDAALARVRQGGIVMANNWHGYADEMVKKDGFVLLAVIEDATNRIVTGNEASGMPVTQTYIMEPGGMTNKNPSNDEIEVAKRDPLRTVLVEYKNTENLWIFMRKKDSE